ncbi:MAG: hypothetical protein IT385_14730 [Deltaproteobacteria bacterium]|nr:hypothetical protein [Deltaproteobacteria bacterium]
MTPGGAPRSLALALVGVGAVTAALVAAGVALLTTQGPRPGAGQGSGSPARVDGCLACHTSPSEDPGGAHAAAIVGCEACHLGDPDAETADAAHRGMEPEPGALRTAARTCGRCHARELERVRTSLMTTGRGLVAVDRWAFGEAPIPDGDRTLADVLAAADPTPAEDHLRRLCAGCHLGTTRDNRDDAIVEGASGCSACHAPAAPIRPEGATLLRHPPVDSRVDDRRCLGCHSRSGRIALGYQGLFETAGAGAEACADPVTLHDGRTGCRTTPDVHHRAGLACVDCHVHNELMGDGTSYAHEEQATEVRCETCHGSATAPAPTTTWAAVTDAITRDLVRQRGLSITDDARVAVGQRGTPLWNVAVASSGNLTLSGKLDGRVHPVRPTPGDLDHARPGHERLTCASCHDPWAPRCATCHTTYDPAGVQWDFGAAAERPGRWHEANEGMGVAPPTLGVDARDRIVPTMPGMIGTLAGRPLRLHALIVPHTTRREARACTSCHADAIALGLGAGALDLTGDAVRFTPVHLDPTVPGESAARDRWVALFPEAPGQTTRVGGRSLDAREQRRVLTVGACLACHDAAHALWRGPFGPALDRLARGGAPACAGRVTAWMPVALGP